MTSNVYTIIEKKDTSTINISWSDNLIGVLFGRTNNIKSRMSQYKNDKFINQFFDVENPNVKISPIPIVKIQDRILFKPLTSLANLIDKKLDLSAKTDKAKHIKNAKPDEHLYFFCGNQRDTYDELCSNYMDIMLIDTITESNIESFLSKYEKHLFGTADEIFRKNGTYENIKKALKYLIWKSRNDLGIQCNFNYSEFKAYDIMFANTLNTEDSKHKGIRTNYDVFNYDCIEKYIFECKNNYEKLLCVTHTDLVIPKNIQTLNDIKNLISINPKAFGMLPYATDKKWELDDIILAVPKIIVDENGTDKEELTFKNTSFKIVSFSALYNSKINVDKIIANPPFGDKYKHDKNNQYNIANKKYIGIKIINKLIDLLPDDGEFCILTNASIFYYKQHIKESLSERCVLIEKLNKFAKYIHICNLNTQADSQSRYPHTLICGKKVENTNGINVTYSSPTKEDTKKDVKIIYDLKDIVIGTPLLNGHFKECNNVMNLIKNITKNKIKISDHKKTFKFKKETNIDEVLEETIKTIRTLYPCTDLMDIYCVGWVEDTSKQNINNASDFITLGFRKDAGRKTMLKKHRNAKLNKNKIYKMFKKRTSFFNIQSDLTFNPEILDNNLKPKYTNYIFGLKQELNDMIDAIEKSESCCFMLCVYNVNQHNECDEFIPFYKKDIEEIDDRIYVNEDAKNYIKKTITVNNRYDEQFKATYGNYCIEPTNKLF